MARLSRATGTRHKAICDGCRQPILATDSILTVALEKHEAMRRATPYASFHAACYRARKSAP